MTFAKDINALTKEWSLDDYEEWIMNQPQDKWVDHYLDEVQQRMHTMYLVDKAIHFIEVDNIGYALELLKEIE